IAVTRTYFWTYAALLLSVGYILPLYNEFDLSTANVKEYEESPTGSVKIGRSAQKGKKRRGRGGTSPQGLPSEVKDYLLPGLLLSIIMITLAYNFMTNPKGIQSTMGIIVAALTQLPTQNYAVSYGVLGLMLISWVLVGTMLTAEVKRYEHISTWLRNLGLALLISGAVSLVYWLWQAGTLAAMARSSAADITQVLQQVGRFENLLTGFYVFIFLILLALGLVLPEGSSNRLSSFTFAGAATAAVGLMVVLLLSAYTNLRVVQADIAFKLAEPFSRSGQWPVAIAIYNRANNLAPTEDYYYLFLGRAYLEQAKTLQNPDEREALISQAANDLKRAQSINPLNTDHTANLARLNSLWASYASSPDEKAKKAQESDYFFSRAVTLSPNSARIWDEWALLYLNILGDPKGGVERLEHALSIDPKYHWTYALLGDYYNRNSRKLEDSQQQNTELDKAAEYYRQALDLPTPGEPAARYSYAIALAGIETQLGNLSNAIEAYEQAIEIAPGDAEVWRIEEALGTLNAQMGDLKAALVHYQNALSAAPEDQKERLINIINQINQS
ncbi:MAG: tetratricopeptide repeat protein, partial [Anaerolineales bacterium]